MYLPAGGDFSNVRPPTITLERGRSSQTLLPCHHPKPFSLSALRTSGPSTGASATITTTATTPAIRALQFFRPAFKAGFPNRDTDYVVAYFTRPPPADVVVVTARAPRAAVGNHPSPWPAAGKDMRYWSMCDYLDTRSLPVVVNILPNGRKDWGCRADDATKLSASGDYTYVIGTEAQRAAIERIPHATFLPLSITQPTAPYLLFLRNTLVVRSFASSVQNAPYHSPSAAAHAMGHYYPRAFVCALVTLNTKGVHACRT